MNIHRAMLDRPPMVSYAQNNEDVLLERCFAGQPRGFYIDVGAWDPDADSVTRHFYLKGWSGINVEPSEVYFGRLVTARPRDLNLNVAVGTEDGATARFLEVHDTGLSGLKDTMEVDVVASTGYTVTERDVEIRSLAAITDVHVSGAVDFLKIDVEGAERAVIESAEWRACRPRVVVVEAVRPVTCEPTWFAWEGLLFDAGYRFALFDGLNRFYFRAEEPELRERLEVPVNVLDNFVPARFLPNLGAPVPR